MNRDDLAREYAREEAELMDTYRAHEDSFKAGWDACARNGNPTPLPEEAEKEARELAEEYARSIVKTEAFSEKGQVTMGFPSWHARQRNCLRNGFLSGYAAGRASVKASPSQAAPQEEGISEETLANLRLDYEWPLVKELTTLRARAEKLVKALKTVLNQPFDGDWDSQALYVQDVLAEWRKPAQLGAEGEKRG